MVVAAPPPSPPAIVRQWSAALNANRNAAAAKLFAPGARILQPGVDVVATPKLALLFNSALPCAGRIIRMTVKGENVVATFVLGERPKHKCDAKPGSKAAALFVVRNGKIVLWEQVAVPAGPSGVPA